MVVRLSVKMLEGRKVGQAGGFSVQWQAACMKEPHRPLFLGFLSGFLPPQMSSFSFCPHPDVFTWLEFTFYTSKRMPTDGVKS